MANHIKNLKVGATAPSLRIQIKNKTDRRPHDLALATATFNMSRVEDDSTLTDIVDAPANVEIPETEGIVSYAWQPTDLGEPGTYLCLFVIAYDDGTVEKYPDTGYIEVRVDASL